jgi:hypothetical protein
MEMVSFDDWKNFDCVKKNCMALIGLDVTKVKDWEDFKGQVYHADRSKIVVRARKLAEEGSRSDFIALAAVLMAMDYSSLASELDAAHGTVLGHWQYTGGERLDALIGVLCMGKEHEIKPKLPADQPVLSLGAH